MCSRVVKWQPGSTCPSATALKITNYRGAELKTFNSLFLCAESALVGFRDWQPIDRKLAMATSGNGLLVLYPVRISELDEGDGRCNVEYAMYLSRLSRSEDWSYSIVMVHGLNGDHQTTWTKDSVFWPRDLLPLKLPKARVMSFGYAANILLNSSTFSIRDHAMKLLTALRDKREEQDVSLKSIMMKLNILISWVP